MQSDIEGQVIGQSVADLTNPEPFKKSF